jgi:hypothetical protein
MRSTGLALFLCAPLLFAAAGTRVRVDNTSESELHELVAVRLPDGDDGAVDELVVTDR